MSDDRRASYGSSQFHQPYGHDHVHVSTVDRHVPYNRVYRHRVFLTPTVYYSHMYRNAQACYYYDWLFCYTSRSNGYYIIDDYPFYVYNGYYHRYSSYDTCNYQLIDTYTRRTVQNFWNLTCNRAYDQCSRERDYWNFREYANRFACAETYREQTYAYFNTFNERDYFVGGYNTSTVDSYYENEYRAPNVNRTFTPSSSQNDNEDEVSPVLGSMSDLGTATSPPPSPSQRHRSRDTQDY